MSNDTNLVKQLLKHREFIKDLAGYAIDEESNDDFSYEVRKARKLLEENEVIVDLQPKSDEWIKFDKDDHTTWPLDEHVLLHLANPYRLCFGYFYNEDEVYGCRSDSEEDSYQIDELEITHWRNIPDSPEIDNE